jgi:aminoglycoside phosphotransferase family enzyme
MFVVKSINIGGIVNDNILIMDNSVDVLDLIVDEFREIDVTNSGTTKSMDLNVQVNRCTLELHSADESQCSTKTVSS